ncbi:uncharacterized protein [Montipora capricornis]|uniref:uncharacterized protein isoform X2 n=1 Tax=Montipora capricornis TaxID=246305 RepID=UPI0035F153C1
MSLDIFLKSFGFMVFLLSGCLMQCSLATNHQLQALFSMSGIKGGVKFFQGHNDGPTNIMVDLEGVNETLAWSIRQLPMVYNGNAAMSCHEGEVGALYDPTMAAKSSNYSTSCTLSSNSRFQDCAVGDLAGMLGKLNANNSKGNFTHQSMMIPITGPNSIMAKTLVLYSGDMPKACALITPKEVMVTAKAVFKYPVAGYVYFRQVVTSSDTDTSLFVNLFYVNSALLSSQFTWQINQGTVSCQIPGEIFNPNSINGQNCSKEKQENCLIGDLSSKHGDVTVSMATKEMSKTKVAFTDTNLPLSGANNVIGKKIVLFSKVDPKRPFACASIMKVKPMVVKATFTASVHDGIDGYFKFTQRSPFDPTTTEISLTGLKRKAEGYHVHNYPMPWEMKFNGSGTCAGGYLGGHWNPFGVDVKSSPSPGTGTNDEYEIGDLSGKYGSFHNVTYYNKRHVDFNLPLFGKNSIHGRSIVIHKMKVMGSGRWVCADNPAVLNHEMFVMKTKVTFKGPALKGYILLIQQKSHEKFIESEETSIYIDLGYASNSSKKSVDHPWHVHVNPEGNDTFAEMGKRCKSLGPHYNPYHVYLSGTYKTSCLSNNMMRCEVGDLSGKHARLNVGFGKQFFTDPDLPLFGEMSVVGRGIVVHAKNGGSARLACGTIKPVKSLYVEKSLQYVQGAGFSRKTFARTVSAILDMPTWRIFYIRKEESNIQGCVTVKFGIIGNEKQVREPSQAFDFILRSSPAQLKEFQPSDDCRPSSSTKDSPRPLPNKARTNQWSSFVIFNTMVIIALANQR